MTGSSVVLETLQPLVRYNFQLAVLVNLTSGDVACGLFGTARTYITPAICKCLVDDNIVMS